MCCIGWHDGLFNGADVLCRFCQKGNQRGGAILLFFQTATLVPQIKQERDWSIFIVGWGEEGC